jgi:hypothetical protein
MWDGPKSQAFGQQPSRHADFKGLGTFKYFNNFKLSWF